MSKIVHSYKSFKWIDLKNPTIDELQTLTEYLNLDIHMLKDSIEHGHLPKLEKEENYTFIILRAYSAKPHKDINTVGELSNKIAFFINSKILITIHRAEFSFLKDIALNDPDSESLMLHIIKKMLDTYSHPIEKQDDEMDKLEQGIFLKRRNDISVETLYYQKSKARISKKIMYLTLDVLNHISVKQKLNSTLEDLKDTVTNYILRYGEIDDNATTILNSYLSITSQRNNDVMRVLTIFSAFFLPLSFITGIYGMNFEYMEILKWRYGYYFVLVMMVFIALAIYIWFKRKNIM